MPIVKRTVTEEVTFDTVTELLAYEQSQPKLVANDLVVDKFAGNGVGEEAGEEEEAAWTNVQMAQLWRLLNLSQRRILTEIATQPEGYDKKDLRNALGVEFKDVMGALGGLRNRTNRMFSELPPVVTVDYDAYLYRMDSDIAELVLTVAGQDRELAKAKK